MYCTIAIYCTVGVFIKKQTYVLIKDAKKPNPILKEMKVGIGAGLRMINTGE